MGSTPDATPPAALALLRPYLERSAELRGAHAVPSYQLRMLAAQVALQLPRDRESNAFLLALLDQLEAEHGAMAHELDVAAAVRTLALDLYARASAADQPGSTCHPMSTWTITTASKVAQCLHASAVLLDSLRPLRALAADELHTQRRAHQRSVQLATQLSRALASPPCVPLEWSPLPAKLLPPLPPPSPPPPSSTSPPPSASAPPTSTSPPPPARPPRPSPRRPRHSLRGSRQPRPRP